MNDAKIVVVTPEMRDKWLHDEIMNKGLLGAVKEQLDEWVGTCRALNYQGFSEATERAQNITDLIKKCAEIERKHPNSEFIEYEEFPDDLPDPEDDEAKDNPCDECDMDCHMCGLTIENDNDYVY